MSTPTDALSHELLESQRFLLFVAAPHAHHTHPKTSWRTTSGERRERSAHDSPPRRISA
jgi:hypothetical protein